MHHACPSCPRCNWWYKLGNSEMPPLLADIRHLYQQASTPKEQAPPSFSQLELTLSTAVAMRWYSLGNRKGCFQIPVSVESELAQMNVWWFVEHPVALNLGSGADISDLAVDASNDINQINPRGRKEQMDINIGQDLKCMYERKIKYQIAETEFILQDKVD